MTEAQRELLATLAEALFDNSQPSSLLEEARKEAEVQAVYALVCSDMRSMQIVTRNLNIAWQQQMLTNLLNDAGISCVVLKAWPRRCIILTQCCANWAI